jgi:hypothetical protein
MSSDAGLAEIRSILKDAAAGTSVAARTIRPGQDQAFLDYCAAALQPSWWH